MVRSPPPSRRHGEGSSRSGRSESRYGDDRDYNNDRYASSGSRGGDNLRRRDYNSGSTSYGYSERERERERVRDRERYERRRSASPRHRISDPAGERSRSGSPVDKAKPNFKNSGLLAAETNTVKAADGKSSTVLKYNEPPEARKPLVGWRLYVFKGKEQTELLHINRQSAYLVGRDRLVADIPVDHPSCSKQHAAIQYRSIKEKDDYGNVKSFIKPFIIDLDSTNGTTVNDEKIPASRYYELKMSDIIKFGQSTKEYVLLHDEVS